MHTRGYTLIEMAVVLAILATLALAAFPLASMLQQRARESELRAALKDIRAALDRYASAHAEGAFTGTPGVVAYPPTLQTLTRPLPDLRSVSAGRPLRLLRRIPRDPFAAADVSAEQSWGLRSFDSEAERPAPGADVYDVYSLSPRKALDGTRYRDW